MRKVTVTTGFERKVVLNFQTWSFSTNFSEEVEVETDAQLTSARRRLRTRAMASVYSDILSDFDKITTAIPESRTDILAQAEALKLECDSAIRSAVAELEGLGK